MTRLALVLLGVFGLLLPAPPARSFDEVVAEIKAFVERERGLPFLREPKIVFAGVEGVAARVRAEQPDLMRENDLHLTLGLVPPDTTLAHELSAFQTSSVQALYDPEADEMVLGDTALTPYVRATIAHELTHVLDDQHFEMHRPELKKTRDGSIFGFSALGEGNARRVERAYVATLSEQEQQEYRAKAGGSAYSYVTRYADAPYHYGPQLVSAILDHGGRQALDNAFRSPPTTNEQVLFPMRYLRGEQARPVGTPSADGPVTDSGVIGAFKLGVMLGAGPGLGPAARWGGDRYAVWHDGDLRACLRARVVGDSPEDTTTLTEALRQWAQRQPDASTREVGGEVEFTACETRDGRPVWTGGSADRCPLSPLPGFAKASLTVTLPGGGTTARCVHLADTQQRVRRGLMEVTDLGGFDGMLFAFPGDTTTAFWMRNTPMPLSIAYVDALGRVVSTADMQPCGDRADCPGYPPLRSYRYAVEVPKGRLADFGLVVGATLHIDGVAR